MFVTIDVGGTLFYASRETLSGRHCFFQPQVHHTYLTVDRDPTHFRHVLNWLRGNRHLPSLLDTLEELRWEADFYCLPDMVAAVDERLRSLRSVPLLAQTLEGIRQELRR